jgi:hypothetical protein
MTLLEKREAKNAWDKDACRAAASLGPQLHVMLLLQKHCVLLFFSTFSESFCGCLATFYLFFLCSDILLF